MRDGRAGGGRGVSRNAHSAGPERVAWLSFTGSRRNSPSTGPGPPGEAGEKQRVDVKGTLAVPPARVLLSIRQSSQEKPPQEQHRFSVFVPCGPRWPPLNSFPPCGDSDESSLLRRLQLPL